VVTDERKPNAARPNGYELLDCGHGRLRSYGAGRSRRRSGADNSLRDCDSAEFARGTGGHCQVRREEHVVSGGFKSRKTNSAIVSRAVQGDSWTVHLYPEAPPLTTYAYCARNGQFSLSRHVHKVRASKKGVNVIAAARCDGGRVASGGYVMSPSPATDANSPNYRDYATSAGKWTVMSVFADPPGNLVAFAYCTQHVRVKVRSRSRSIPAEVMQVPGFGSATARCHKGETLLSGGYTSTPTPDWENMSGPDSFTTARVGREGVRGPRVLPTTAPYPASSRCSLTAPRRTTVIA
jgi:hypothetical protein